MKVIKTLKDIDTTTPEGRYLMSALAKLTVTVDASKTPDECIGTLHKAVVAMYGPVTPVPGYEQYTKQLPEDELAWIEEIKKLYND